MERDRLESLSIFELRDFARKIGVFNPTVLKKNDLITAIQDVQSGKVEPHIAKTKQGRPPKEIGRLASIFMPAEVTNIPTVEEKRYEHVEEPLKFCCDLEKPEDGEPILYKGYFELLATEDGLLRKKIDWSDKPFERCFLRSKTIKKYNIKPGDEVVCNAYYIADDRPLLADTILSINNIAFNEEVFERPDFDSLPYIYSNKKIEFKDDNLSSISVSYGDTIFVHNDSVINFVNFAVKMAIDNSHCFDKYVYLSPVSKGDKFHLLRQFPDELYLATFTDSFSTQQRTAFMAINRAKRLAESGKNVCLIVQDILELASLDNNDPDGALRISKDILSSSKNMEKGSLTIICGFKDIQLPYMRHKVNTTFAPLETVGITLDN